MKQYLKNMLDREFAAKHDEQMKKFDVFIDKLNELIEAMANIYKLETQIATKLGIEWEAPTMDMRAEQCK